MKVVESPVGCPKFEPNPFKKDRCKGCSRAWNEHKGVIDKKLLDGFMAGIKKAEDAKLKAEEEAKAQAKAKKLAKRRNSAAAEDKWLCDDGAPQDAGDSDEEDVGFQMITPQAGASNNAAAVAERNKALKVVNLINFDECDVIDEKEGSGSGSRDGDDSTVAPTAASSYSHLNASPMGASCGSATSPRSPSSPSRAAAAAEPSPARAGPTRQEQDLRAELELLRVQLADSNEMKEIEVSIARDEAAEKQAMIDELLAKQKATEEALSEARRQLQAASLAPGAATAGSPADVVAAESIREMEALRAALAAAERRTAELQREVAAERSGRLQAQEALQAAMAAAARSAGGATGTEVKHAAALNTAQERSRRVAEALLEIRRSAESQLLWIEQRRCQMVA